MAEKVFEQKVNKIVTNGFLALALGIGQRLDLFTKLFECSEAGKKPMTSVELAETTGYRERYVREWLSAMAVAELVDCNGDGTHFWLTEEKASALQASSGRMLSIAAFLPMFGRAAEKVAECFKPDGPTGLPYSEYTEFSEFMTQISKDRFQNHLLQDFIPSVPGLVGQLEKGLQVLDIGCGTGMASAILAARFPNSHFTGIDFEVDAINSAQELQKLPNLQYRAMDAAKLDPAWTAHFDYVTAFDSIHDQAYPDQSLSDIARVLKPGGLLSMFDVKGTSNPRRDRDELKDSSVIFYNMASFLHCMPVSLYFPGGLGLGAMWGEKVARKMLAEAGFADVQVLDTFSPANVHYLCKNSS